MKIPNLYKPAFTFAVPLVAVYEFVLQSIGVRQGKEQAGEKFAAPRKTALRERLVTETLEQRNEPTLVLQNLAIFVSLYHIRILFDVPPCRHCHLD